MRVDTLIRVLEQLDPKLPVRFLVPDEIQRESVVVHGVCVGEHPTTSKPVAELR